MLAARGVATSFSQATSVGSGPTAAELRIQSADLRECAEALEAIGFSPLGVRRTGGAEFVAFDRAAGDWVRLSLRPASPGAAFGRSPIRRLRVLRPPRELSVAVMGPDGAGKSTLIASLEHRLPVPVRTIYMGLYQDVPNRRAARRTVPGVGLLTNLGRLRLRWFRALVLRLRGHLVLFDRYSYDALLPAEGALSRLGRLRRWLLGNSCPAPDLLVVLDAPAEVLFARKGEHDLALLDRHRQGLLRLADERPESVVIDATRDPEAVVRAVSGAIWEQRARRWR